MGHLAAFPVQGPYVVDCNWSAILYIVVRLSGVIIVMLEVREILLQKKGKEQYNRPHPSTSVQKSYFPRSRYDLKNMYQFLLLHKCPRPSLWSPVGLNSLNKLLSFLKWNVFLSFHAFFLKQVVMDYKITEL